MPSPKTTRIIAALCSAAIAASGLAGCAEEAEAPQEPTAPQAIEGEALTPPEDGHQADEGIEGTDGDVDDFDDTQIRDAGETSGALDDALYDLSALPIPEDMPEEASPEQLLDAIYRVLYNNDVMGVKSASVAETRVNGADGTEDTTEPNETHAAWACMWDCESQGGRSYSLLALWYPDDGENGQFEVLLVDNTSKNAEEGEL